MQTPKKSIQRSMIVGSVAFLLILCVLLSAMAYFLISSALYTRYRERLTDVITYVERNADAEDLLRCVETGVPTEGYARFERFLNDLGDAFSLSYLYVVIPEPELGLMVNVVSASGAAARTAGDKGMGLLVTTSAYPPLVLERYRALWEKDEITFFEESAEFGSYYTACKPLKTAEGRTVALLCADVPIRELHRTVAHYMVLSTAAMLLIGLVFTFFLLRWLRKNVTGPVLELEKSARRFAEKSHSLRDPRQLVFDAPEIATDNEVQSLSGAILKMSADLKAGVERFLSAEARATSAEIEAEDMTRIAYQDALTHVKSKAAFNAKSEELAEEIRRGGASFALLMIDINELKRINDTYGHDFGDRYLIGACSRICQIYKHSPVYRIGGDEFVVLLQGVDYENREALLLSLREQFMENWEDESKEPWERFSAAAGMAEYTGAPGEDVEQVLARADKEMYRAKVEMKAELRR